MGMSYPKVRMKCQTPLLKITGVITPKKGLLHPKTRQKQCQAPLLERKIKMINNLIKLGVTLGHYTQRQKCRY